MSVKPSDARARFCNLMRDIFQFAKFDLDFGMYRIMNQRRDKIDAFLNTGLPRAIAKNLGGQEQAESNSAVNQKRDLRAKIEKELSGDAFDEAGNLQKHRDTNLGKTWLAVSESAAAAQSSDELEAAVFNHLHEFFSRYYDEGDFIPKRRHGGGKGYSVQYGGEEVLFHWANRGQYYIKTTERFQRYDFKADGLTVRFEIRSAANLPENNNKSEKRFYIPLPAEMRENNGIVAVPFEYRPLNEKEKKKYGTKNIQDKIMDDAKASIENAKTLSEKTKAALLKKHHTGESSIIIHHIRRYVRRSTADFFIHKNLHGFLSDELDIYLKSEAVSAEDIDVGGIHALRQRIIIFRAARKIGGKIIDFLAQLENFQKRLWEKKKFITRAEYFVTIGNIADEKILREILQCEKQWEEWRKLLGMDSEENGLFTGKGNKADKRRDFVKSHPSLPVDTANFTEDFKDALLSHLSDSGDLDDMCDGVLIHGENYQALNLLTEKYRKKIKCVYIDPPYNTGPSEIIYKNGYKDSSWLCLMESRYELTKHLMEKDSAIMTAIDDYEFTHLAELLDVIFATYERYAIVVNHHPQGAGMGDAMLSRTHEYMIIMTSPEASSLKGQRVESGVEYRSFRRAGQGANNFRGDFSNNFYAILIEPKTLKVVGLESPPTGKDYPKDKTSEGYIRIYPIGQNGEERVWRLSYKSAMELVNRGKITCTSNFVIRQVINHGQEKRAQLFSNWTGAEYNAGVHGANLLESIMGNAGVFSYPKSIHTVTRAIESKAHSPSDAIILDYFAGSGTTAHAVINLNREDGGNRKFILVEMGEYFDSVLLPRIKKVTYTPEWKDGKPKQPASEQDAKRGPRLVKYVRLESYDDAMDNIALESPDSLLAKDEEYFIKYALNHESRNDSAFLPGAIKSPFDYKLHKAASGGGELSADLPETFNYLIGLHVKSRRIFRGGNRRYLIYRGIADGVEVAVIWRDTKGWKSSDRERDRDIIQRNKFAEGAERIYVNDDSLVKGAESLDPFFKSAMFGMTAEK